MPPPMPISPAWSTASSAVSTFCASPRARPAADSRATRMTASPLADSQPKKAAPHLIPPKRTRWASTASRAEPRVTVAPSVRTASVRTVSERTVGSTCVGVVRVIRTGHGWASSVPVGCGDPPAVGVLCSHRCEQAKRCRSTFARTGDGRGCPGDGSGRRRSQRRGLAARRLVARPRGRGRRGCSARLARVRGRRRDGSGRRAGDVRRGGRGRRGPGAGRPGAGRRPGRAGTRQRGRRPGGRRRGPRRAPAARRDGRPRPPRPAAGAAPPSPGPGWLLAELDRIDRAPPA